MKGYTESEELKHWWPTMPVTHACARSSTPHVGPHWDTTHFLEVAKATDACSTLRNAKESNTELYDVRTLEGGRGKPCLICQLHGLYSKVVD